MNKKIVVEKYLSKEEIRVLTNFSADSRLSDRMISILKKNNQCKVKNVKGKIEKYRETF